MARTSYDNEFGLRMSSRLKGLFFSGLFLLGWHIIFLIQSNSDDYIIGFNPACLIISPAVLIFPILLYVAWKKASPNIGIAALCLLFIGFAAPLSYFYFVIGANGHEGKLIKKDVLWVIFSEGLWVIIFCIVGIVVLIKAKKAAKIALEQYDYLFSSNPDMTRFDEEKINQLGYDLLEMKKTDDAIKVFELNVKMYPQSANARDSLGDANIK
jgi:hypothetical protein